MSDGGPADEPPSRSEIAALEAGIESVAKRVGSIHSHLYYESITFKSFVQRFERFMVETEDRQRDLLEALLRSRPVRDLGWRLVTDHPIAADSADHVFPRGTIADNTRSPRFVAACEAHFGRPLAALDIGCAGGGLVWDFTQRGHAAVGIEGSDRSRRARRAEWRIIPDRLFVADVRYPFRVEDGEGEVQRFDVISAWELFEHIPEADVSTLLGSILRHLAMDGLLVASVATFQDTDDKGHQFHATIRPKEWWMSMLRENGLEPIDSPFALEDYARGSGNPRASDWNAETHPQLGFHIVARAARPPLPALD